MKRFWASWFCRPETFPEALRSNPWPWPIWNTGIRADGAEVYCAVVDAASEDEARASVTREAPGLEWRFCEERVAGWLPPADRFPPSKKGRFA